MLRNAQRNRNVEGEEPSAAMLRRYSKLQSACVALQEAVNVINENTLNSEEILQLANSNNDLERAIAESPAVLVSKYIHEVHYGISDAFNHYKFEDGAPGVSHLVKYPVVSSAYLENLAFLHRSWSSMNIHATEVDKAVATNERLEFLGDSWLGAFVSYILYKKYPYANEGSLSKMRSAIVNNVNLAKWCQQVGFDKRLCGNIPKVVNKLKDMTSKYHADCFEAYIGALVVDKYSNEYKEVVDWIEDLCGNIFEEMGSKMTKEPMNKNAKHELATLLMVNKAGAKLTYQRLNSTSPFRVEVKLGDISLATAEGSSIKEAEQRAAMKALLDTTKIKTYSFYELDDKPIADSQVKGSEELLLTESSETTISSGTDESDKTRNKDSPPPHITTENGPADIPTVDVVEKEVSEHADKPTVAEGDLPDGVSDIVEQILNRLKDTVLTSVTAVLNENALSNQQVPAGIQQPAKTTLQTTRSQGRPNDQATNSNTASASNTSFAKRSSLLPSDSDPLRKSIDRDAYVQQYPPQMKSPKSGAQNMPYTKALKSLSPTSKLCASPIAQPAKLPEASHAEPKRTNSPVASSSAEIEPAAKKPSSQKSSNVDSFPASPSAKQELYAFLGQRGFKPYYDTRSVSLQSFSSDCLVQGFNIILGTGQASSKKQAEQLAASYAFKGSYLREFLDNPGAFANE